MLLTHFPELEFSFVRNELYESTNNIHSLALAFEQMDFSEDIILLESDLIYEPAVLRRLIASKHDNVAVVDRYRMGLDGTVVALSESKVITQVIPASLQGPSFDFSDKYKTLNIYKFSAEFCRTIFSRLLSYYSRIIDNNCYYELILGILIYMQQAQIHAETLGGEIWAEVDDPNDLRNAEFVFAPQHRRSHLESSWGGYWNTPIIDFAFIRNMHFPPDSMVSQLDIQLFQPHNKLRFDAVAAQREACELPTLQTRKCSLPERCISVSCDIATLLRRAARAITAALFRGVSPCISGMRPPTVTVAAFHRPRFSIGQPIPT